MDKTDSILQAEEICRAMCIRQALARFLKISPDQLENSEGLKNAALAPEFSIALSALAGDGADSDLFSDDQRSLLSTALQLSEQEILYLLECAADKADEPGRARS